MNILYISSKKRWGGITSWMDITAKGLEKRGHSVWILSHPKSKLNTILQSNPHLISRKLGAYYSPISILYIMLLIIWKKIDLVVTNIDKEVAIGGIAARLCKIPNIRRVGREDDFNNIPRKRWNYKFLVDQSIVPCNYIRDEVVRIYSYLKKSDFTTIYNGRNITSFSDRDKHQLKNKWNIKQNEKLIGISCQLLKIKHVDHLIKAFHRISESNPLWKVVITGDGPEKQNLMELVQKLKLKSKVIFTGFSNNPSLTASVYDICVLTSKLEGLPNSIVEYFSAGKPVIVTDVGGVSEIVQDGVNGFLVPFGNIDLIAQRLETLIKDTKLRSIMSEQAILTIKNNFTEDKMIDELEKFFLENMRY